MWLGWLDFIGFGSLDCGICKVFGCISLDSVRCGRFNVVGFIFCCFDLVGLICVG